MGRTGSGVHRTPEGHSGGRHGATLPLRIRRIRLRDEAILFGGNDLSLLDRGFIFAIAHVRGGDDLGYHWYEAGKLDRRTNTFNDFVDVARHLIEQGYGSRGRIAISGGSAGGELMGAVVNQAPELWGAVAAHVPFVDVLNTMLDDTLPLTPIEWPEWGNPIEDRAFFEYIRSYSPYDQLEQRDYPPILVTAGLNDPQGDILGAGQVRGKATGTEDGQQLVAAEDEYGRGTRRQVGKVRPALRGGGGVRVYPGVHGAAGVAVHLRQFDVAYCCGLSVLEVAF